MKNFILGTDWWSDCDDCVALRILLRAHKKGAIKLKGIIINACMDDSVASIDAFMKDEAVTDIPVGIDLGATDYPGKLTYQKILAPFSNKTNKDAEDAVKLYRKILAESTEKVEIIEIGFLQVVAALLKSKPDEISDKTGIELVREKVSKFWVMAGKWDEDNGSEHNFALNERSRMGGYEFCKLCPVPVTFLGWEIGKDVVTGSNLLTQDVLHKVLVAHGSESGRLSWDPMLVLMAVIGDEVKSGYDVVTGFATVDAETGNNHFRVAKDGLHKYVVKKFDNSYYVDKINEIIK